MVDQDGYAKPAILILLEELDRAEIEEICLVIGEHDKELYDKFFNESLSEEHLSKLPSTMRAYEAKIQAFGTKIKYIIQKERLGFGHAVYQCKEFANEEPVLLMLGDHIYKSLSGQCCAQQIIEMFDKTGMLTIAVHPIDLKNVNRYGIVTGSWENEEETVLNVSEMVEKPSCDFQKIMLLISSGQTSQLLNTPFQFFSNRAPPQAIA